MKWWEDPVNKKREPVVKSPPKVVAKETLPEPTLKTMKEREDILRQCLEVVERKGLDQGQRGSKLWTCGVNAKKALDEAYGRDRCRCIRQ